MATSFRGRRARAEEAAMAAILNSPIARFQEVYWADRAAFDRAAITPEDYWDTVANRLSRTLTENRTAADYEAG